MIKIIEIWRIEKGTYLKKCARCGTEGIPEWDSDSGDEQFTKILTIYRDADSEYDGKDLCFDCTCLEDLTVSNRNEYAERIGRIPTPWE